MPTDLIIDAIYSDIVRGKLDQKQGQFEVEYTMGRDLEPGKLEELLSSLQNWASTTSAVLATLDQKLAELSTRSAIAKKEKEQYDSTYQATLREVADKQKEARNANKPQNFTGRTGVTAAGLAELARERERQQQREREKAKESENQDSMDIDEPAEGSKGKARKGWPAFFQGKPAQSRSPLSASLLVIHIFRGPLESFVINTNIAEFPRVAVVHKSGFGGSIACGLEDTDQRCRMETAEAIQREQLERMRDFLGPQAQPEGHSTRSTSKIESLITFKNPRAREFFVDGTSIPDVNFDAGPSWSGLMPISGHPNETRKLFFWLNRALRTDRFWPTNNAANVNDLLFWTNGGPGCSSLEGFLQENGPICGNPWSWTNLSNVLWVEQPVGTGFSQGDPDISNDDELAAQVAGFLQQFLEVFSELKGSNFWVSGESVDVPYIANYLYEHPGIVDLQLHGIWIADPSLTWGLVQQEIPALRFAQANKNVFPFNSSFWAQLQNISDSCGYTDYLDSVTYPPKGQLPLPVGATFNETTRAVGVKPECRIHSPIQRAVGVINPVFDVYRVTDTFPNLWSVLGFPRSTQKFIYFNSKRINISNLAEPTDRSVYINPTTGGPGNDQSVASTLSVLPNVIEKSKRVAIVHGLADFILVAEGTRIAIQYVPLVDGVAKLLLTAFARNMTWNGKQGFQSPIEPETFLVENMGTFGNMHIERGLAFVEFYYSGHMTPQFVPWAAFQTIAYVLGKRDSPSA
ncbi:hypothetical protein ACG7TL_000973 [Trametes sanguinea]